MESQGAVPQAACGNIPTCAEVGIFPQRRHRAEGCGAEPAGRRGRRKGCTRGSGLSQAELASELGFSRDYMIDIESGKPNIYLKRLSRVFARLGVKTTLEYEVPSGA